MAVTVKLRYLRIAPRKVRQVADLIRGKSVEEAQAILAFTVKKAVHPISKLLKSAMASARNNFQLDETNLYISRILVDEGPKLKRWRARARGRAAAIQKKTSHITIVLDEIKKEKKPKRIKKVVKKKRAPLVAKEKQIKKVPKPEEKVPKEKVPPERPKFRFRPEEKKPKIVRGIRKIFRRKAF